MEFEANTKAEEYNERKRKYEESNDVFYENAPIYRPPKLPPGAGENMDFFDEVCEGGLGREEEGGPEDDGEV